MPLQPCPGCHTLFSESATLCPKCVRANPTAKRTGKADKLAGSWGLVVLAVVGTGFFIYVCRSDPSAMFLAQSLGLIAVIFAVKHTADLLKRKDW